MSTSSTIPPRTQSPRPRAATAISPRSTSERAIAHTGEDMIERQVDDYDVCIVGSGAGGGMAAYVLTQAGAKVVMLEAGGEWYASKDSQMLTPALASPRRGSSTRLRPFGEVHACVRCWCYQGETSTSASE